MIIWILLNKYHDKIRRIMAVVRRRNCNEKIAIWQAIFFQFYIFTSVIMLVFSWQIHDNNLICKTNRIFHDFHCENYVWLHYRHCKLNVIFKEITIANAALSVRKLWQKTCTLSNEFFLLVKSHFLQDKLTINNVLVKSNWNLSWWTNIR